MALNGSVYKKVQGYTYQIDWVGVQDAAKNQTTITCTHTLKCDDRYGLRIGSRTIYCSIGSERKVINTPDISTSGNETRLLGQSVHVIKHDSYGNASPTLVSTFPMNATISQKYYIGDITLNVPQLGLDKINRASILDFDHDFKIYQQNDVYLRVGDTHYKHNIWCEVGGVRYTIVSNAIYDILYPTIKWTPPEAIFDAVPNDSSIIGIMTVESRDGNNNLIGTNSCQVKFVVPDTYQPAIGAVVLEPELFCGVSNVLVQNTNKLTIKAVNCRPSKGAKIITYYYSGFNTEFSSTSPEETLDPISKVGDLTYTITVIDSRGRKATKSSTIKCNKKDASRFSYFNIYRDGSDVKCDYTIQYSEIRSSSNEIVDPNIRISISIAKKGEETKVALSGSSQTGVVILQNAEDTTYIALASGFVYNDIVFSNSKTIFGTKRIFNITADGTGIGIGKKAESNNLVDIVPKVISRSGFSLNKNIGAECVIFGAYNLMTHDRGQNATFNIGKSASNFGYIEIFYSDGANQANYSTKIHNPNGKYVMLTCVADDGTVKFSKWKINGTEIAADASIKNADIKIHKVLGYLS